MKTVNRILGEMMTGYEETIYMNPEMAGKYAIGMKRRFPEAEPYIVKDPFWACMYALYVLKRRWPEAEPTIIENPEWAYHYAILVIHGRWPEAEPIIAKSKWRDDYINAFKLEHLRDEWRLNGWIEGDWL